MLARIVACACYVCGMARVRVSTTVDADLLAQARQARPGDNDSSVVEASLSALLAAHRRAEVDAAYSRAWRERPVGERDAWGDPEEFARAAAAT